MWQDPLILSLRKPELGDKELSVQVATSAQAIKDLTPFWTKWTHSLDTDIEYYLHTVRTDPTILSPYVITVCEGDVTQAMLVGLLREKTVSVIVGWVRISGPTARVLEVTKGGRVGRQSALMDKLIALQLSVFVESNHVDMLSFQDMPSNSELFNQLNHLPRVGLKHHVVHADYDSVLLLTTREGKPAAIFSGKNKRENRRKKRILERAFPNKTRFRCFSDSAEMAAGIGDAFTIADKTWQYHVGCGLTNSLEDRERFKFFSKQGWLRIYILYINDVPCAFLIGQLYRRTFYCHSAGYHFRFARFSIGSLLIAWAFEKLAETGTEQVDLGTGNQEFNRRLGCLTCEDVQLHLYAPTLRGLWLSMFFATTQIMRAAAHKIRSRLKLNRIRKLWRDFLVTKSMREP